MIAYTPTCGPSCRSASRLTRMLLLMVSSCGVAAQSLYPSQSSPLCEIFVDSPGISWNHRESSRLYKNPLCFLIYRSPFLCGWILNAYILSTQRTVPAWLKMDIRPSKSITTTSGLGCCRVWLLFKIGLFIRGNEQPYAFINASKFPK